MRVIEGNKQRQLLRVVVVSVLAVGQMLLAVHACTVSAIESTSRSAVATQSSTTVASATAPRASEGAANLAQRTSDDCVNLVDRAVLASEPGIQPYRSRVAPRVTTDLPKPVFAGRARVSWFGMAERGEVDSSWLGNPRALNGPPHTILHCCWRI